MKLTYVIQELDRTTGFYHVVAAIHVKSRYKTKRFLFWSWQETYFTHDDIIEAREAASALVHGRPGAYRILGVHEYSDGGVDRYTLWTTDTGWIFTEETP